MAELQAKNGSFTALNAFISFVPFFRHFFKVSPCWVSFWWYATIRIITFNHIHQTATTPTFNNRAFSAKSTFFHKNTPPYIYYLPLMAKIRRRALNPADRLNG